MPTRGRNDSLARATPSRRARRLFPALAIVAIAASGVGITISAWANPFALDDHSKVVQNPDIRDLRDLPSKLVHRYEGPKRFERNDPSRPLVFAIWTVVYHAYGLNPIPYRVVNALLHALGAVLVFVIVRTVFARLEQAAPAGAGAERALRAGDLAALVAGVLFAVLPIQTGTVIYAYGLSDVLSASLCLGATALYLASPTRGRLAGALVCQLLALLAKQSAVTLPLLLMAFDWAVPGSGRLRSRLRRVIPFVALSVAYLTARGLYFGALGDLEGGGELEPFSDYVSSQPLVLLRYLTLTVVPHALAIDHHLAPGADPAWLKLLGALGVLVILVVTARIARRGTPQGRLVVLGVLMYVISLAPTSTVFPTVDTMVERRVYLGNVGVLLVGAVALRALFLRGGSGATRRGALVLAACVAIVIAYALVALERNRTFASRVAIWEEVLAIYPDSPRALTNYAAELVDRQDYDRAHASYRRAIELHPHAIPLAGLARLHELPESPYRDVDQALALYQRAIDTGSGPAWIYFNAARIHHRQGRLGEAERLYREGLEQDPGDVYALTDLGVLYVRLQSYEQARRCFEEALRRRPGLGQAHDHLDRLEREGR